MLNIFAIAVLQFVSITSSTNSQTLDSAPIATVMIGNDVAVRGGTGGWGNDVTARGGTGGWGNDVTA